jgi:hypothetical protein
MATPLLRKIKKGTFVTFQSTERDMQFILGKSSNRDFKISKYALLNIPPLKTPNNFENSINVNNIESVFTDGQSTASPPPEGDKTDLAESLQNYLLNMESLMIGDEAYSNSGYTNTAERLFFKWLKEIGAIRFRQANIDEVATGVETRYAEESNNNNPTVGDVYNGVIKCIGEVDMQGSNAVSNANASSEIYIYLPSVNGSTPTVLFKTEQDNNYYPGKTIKQKDVSKQEHILGRDASDNPSSAGLSVLAQYDMDSPQGTYDYEKNGVPDDTWFKYNALNGPNAYFTDEEFSNAGNDIITRSRTNPAKTVTYKRSKLDGIMIDFEQDNYFDFEQDIKLKAFNEYNSVDRASNFEFNAALLYYDVYDPTNDQIRGTNLYGIVFFNDMEIVSTGAAKIATHQKIKQINAIGQQGNGLGIKLNIKIDVNPDDVDVDVDVSVNDYNTFSMVLFADTMQRLAQINSNYENLKLEHAYVLKKFDDLQSYVMTDIQKEDILSEIGGLSKAIGEYTDNNTILDLVTKNEDKIKEMLNGETSVNVSYNLDIKSYDGLRMALSGGILTLRNTRQKYWTSEKFSLNTQQNQQIGKYNILKLSDFDTLYYHTNDGGGKIAQDNIYIYINDKINWKLNQSFTIAFDDEIDMNGFGMAIYTDSTNKFKLSEPYSKLVGVVPVITKKKPTIEIVCVDAENYKFIIMEH